MTKIFIDTNIFLGLYYSNLNPVTIFEDIFKLKSNLILTDQVHDEFIRNRDIQLQYLIENSKNYIPKYPTSSLIRSLKEFSDLNKIKKDLQDANETLIKKLQEMKEDTDKDPVFKWFLKLYNDSKITKYERNEDIIKKAYNRKLIGNPPLSKKDSIGDEVNWEIIISNLKDDLVIIAMDKTYNDHITFLKREFKLKTNKELFIDEKISFALIKMGKTSSEELNKLEEEQSKKRILSDVSGNIKLSTAYCVATPDSSGNISDNIIKITQLSTGADIELCPHCGYHERRGSRCLRCGYNIACDYLV